MVDQWLGKVWVCGMTPTQNWESNTWFIAAKFKQALDNFAKEKIASE